jgi:HlyD family secretion protein
LNQSLANLANVKANLALQQANLKRAAELFTNNLIASSDYDTALAQWEQAAAQVKIQEAAVTNATASLNYCKILSPVDGVVISRAVELGQTVASSFSTPTMFNIANDLTKMQIDANISEADIGMVAEGQDVTFTVDAFPDGKFTGKVIQIRNSPTTVQNVVTYDTVIAVGNPELKLRPGMTANASIISAQRPGALRIPNAAFRFRLPEQPTNTSFLARLFGGSGSKPLVTNATPAMALAGAGATNALAAAGGETPLTGNEPPDELQRRVGQMRANGEDIPPEIMTKLRGYYQSGVLQRPMRGGGGPGGGPGGSPGGGSGGRGGGSRGSQPAFRTVYVLPTNSAFADQAPQAVRVRTGINDGSSTEITSGLNEGDLVVIGLKFPQSASAPPPGGQASPFGGGGGGFGGPRGR